MMELLYRSFAVEDLAVRDAYNEGDGRTVEGLLVPFGKVADVADIGPNGVVRYREMFRFGAFDRAEAVPHRVVLAYGHSESFGDRLGHAIELRQSVEGLHAVFRLDASRAAAARDALSTSHGALSIGFTTIDPRPRTEREGDVIERRAVHLFHVAAVPKGAYAEAAVGSIRAEAMLDEDDADRAERQARAAEREQSQALMAKIDEMVATQAALKARIAGAPAAS